MVWFHSTETSDYSNFSHSAEIVSLRDLGGLFYKVLCADFNCPLLSSWIDVAFKSKTVLFLHSRFTEDRV